MRLNLGVTPTFSTLYSPQKIMDMKLFLYFLTLAAETSTTDHLFEAVGSSTDGGNGSKSLFYGIKLGR